MKKLIVATGLLMFLGGVAVAGCLVLAGRLTNNAHQAFFDQVASGDADAFLQACTPELKEEVDAPVLMAWMNQVNTKLGAFQSTSGFRYNVQQINATTITQVNGTTNFDKGQAEVELIYHGDALAGFTVESPQLAGNWFKGPDDTTLYQDRTKAFYTALVTDRADDSFDMMHDALQKEVPGEPLVTMADTVKRWSGELTEMRIVGEEFSADNGRRWIVKAEIVGESNTLDATATFQFIGLKGHLIEFDVAPPAK